MLQALADQGIKSAAVALAAEQKRVAERKEAEAAAALAAEQKRAAEKKEADARRAAEIVAAATEAGIHVDGDGGEAEDALVRPPKPMPVEVDSEDDDDKQPKEQDTQRVARLARHKAVRTSCMQDDADSDSG